MAEKSTIARPYAQAVFELAREEGEFGRWSKLLAIAAVAVRTEQGAQLLEDPALTPDRKAEMLASLYQGDADREAHNLLRLLAHYRRLGVLPEIAERYEELRAEAEGTVDVEVVSVAPVTEDEQARLAQVLRERLGREVRMHNVIDEELIGGAIIRAGDLVIDGSVRGRLQQLSASLMAR